MIENQTNLQLANKNINISTAKKIDLKLRRHQSDESKRPISMFKIILKPKLFLLELKLFMLSRQFYWIILVYLIS